MKNRIEGEIAIAKENKLNHITISLVEYWELKKTDFNFDGLIVHTEGGDVTLWIIEKMTKNQLNLLKIINIAPYIATTVVGILLAKYIISLMT